MRNFLRTIVSRGLAAALRLLHALGIDRTRTYVALPERLRRLVWAAPLPPTIRLEAPGRTLVFEGSRRSTIYKAYYWWGFMGYEPRTSRFFQRNAPRYKWFCDIGAYTGHYTTLFGLANDKATIRSFEPVPSIADALSENLARNGVKNAAVVRAAVSGASGVASFYLPKNSISELPSIGSLRQRFRGEARFADHGEREVTVQVKSATEALAGLPPGLGLIKIDAEGSESEILSACAPALGAARPDLIFEVSFPPEFSHAEVDSLLLPLGYSYCVLGEPPRKLGKLTNMTADMLPARKDREGVAWGEVLATAHPDAINV